MSCFLSATKSLLPTGTQLTLGHFFPGPLRQHLLCCVHLGRWPALPKLTDRCYQSQRRLGQPEAGPGSQSLLHSVAWAPKHACLQESTSPSPVVLSFQQGRRHEANNTAGKGLMASPVCGCRGPLSLRGVSAVCGSTLEGLRPGLPPRCDIVLGSGALPAVSPELVSCF